MIPIYNRKEKKFNFNSAIYWKKSVEVCGFLCMSCFFSNFIQFLICTYSFIRIVQKIITWKIENFWIKKRKGRKNAKWKVIFLFFFFDLQLASILQNFLRFKRWKNTKKFLIFYFLCKHSQHKVEEIIKGHLRAKLVIVYMNSKHLIKSGTMKLKIHL